MTTAQRTGWRDPASYPQLEGFDPLAADQLADPSPWLARARSEKPVFYMPHEEMWCITRYRDVLAILKNTSSYSNRDSDAVVAPRPPAYAHVMPKGHPVSNSLHTKDPPAHTRIRKLAQKAFTRRHADAREHEINAIANRLIDRFVGEQEVDLVEVFTCQIPSAVIAAILGAPPDCARRLQSWTDDFFVMAGNRHLPQDENARLWDSALAFEAFVSELVAEKRARLGDDLISDLIQATAGDGTPSLTDYEVVCVVAGLVAAGADTTNALVADALDLLLSEPEQWKALTADLALVPNAVEETLRLRSPVRGLRRLTKEPVDIGGVEIPEGNAVFLHLGSANRDADVFADPNRFDLHRPNVNDHLALGLGVHFCLGAPLARVESCVAIDALAKRLPGLRRVPDQQLVWRPSTYVTGPAGLRVTLR